MKKICASAFSANGIDESKTRQRLIDVDPTSGARRQTITAADAEYKPRDGDSAGDAHGRGGSAARATGMTVSWPVLAFAVMSTSTPYSLPNQRRIEHCLRCTGRENASAMQQHELSAETGRKIQVMCRYDNRQVTLAVQLVENRADLELIREIERGGRLVEQQNVGILRKRAGNDDALFFAAGERVEQPRREVVRPGCAAGPRARSRDPQVLRSRTRQGADSGPSSPSRAPCTRMPGASPAAPSPSASRQSRAESHEDRRRRARCVLRKAATIRPSVEAASSCPSRWDPECQRVRLARPQHSHRPAPADLPRRRRTICARRRAPSEPRSNAGADGAAKGGVAEWLHVIVVGQVVDRHERGRTARHANLPARIPRGVAFVRRDAWGS